MEYPVKFYDELKRKSLTIIEPDPSNIMIFNLNYGIGEKSDENYF